MVCQLSLVCYSSTELQLYPHSLPRPWGPAQIPQPPEPVIPTTREKEGCSPTDCPLPGRPYQGFLSFFFFLIMRQR